jgi:hypothetical protein
MELGVDIFKPDTVLAWDRKAVRRFWSWKVRRGKPERPAISRDIRELMRRMSSENTGWGCAAYSR